MEMEDAEVFADPLDSAARNTDLATQEAVANRRRLAAPEQVKVEVTREDGSVAFEWPEPDCIDCGETIPEKRLEATGSVRCVHCQSIKEQRSRTNGMG